MKLVEQLNGFLKNINELNDRTLDLAMNHVHARGVFSLVIKGEEHGKLTRVFISSGKIKPFDVQLHTHRYPIKITVLKGKITHHLAEIVYEDEPSDMTISKFTYRSFLNGGKGLEYDEEVRVKIREFIIPVGSVIELGVFDYHTMSCSKDSMWIVEEMGFDVDESKVLGIPFIVDGLYEKPAMFQINDKIQVVRNEIKKLVETYKLL